MAHADDWLPHSQDEFVTWSQQYVAGVDQYAAVLGIPPAKVTTLKTAEATYLAAWNEYAIQEKSPSVNAGKKAVFKAQQTVIRDFQNQNMRFNKALTNEIRRACGLPESDDHKEHIPVGPNHIAFTLESRGTGQVEIKCHEEETGERKITYGKSGIVLAYAVGPAPITDFDLLNQSVLITKVTHIFTFTPNQRGLWLTVSACWQSRTGEKGSWSVLQSAIIP